MRAPHGSVREDLVAVASDDGGRSATDCAEALELLLGHVDGETLARRLGGAALGPVRIVAETAEVELPGPESPVRLRREEGEWRISQLRSSATGRAAARLEAIDPL